MPGDQGRTDQDLDPTLAEASWREALAVAESLGDQGWVNRARGELGLVAFLQGNVNASIVALGQALKVAQTTGDTPSGLSRVAEAVLGATSVGAWVLLCERGSGG
jgi:hypothetical protein